MTFGDWLKNKIRGKRKPESNAEHEEIQRPTSAELAELSERERNLMLRLRELPLDEQRRLAAVLDLMIGELWPDDSESD